MAIVNFTIPKALQVRIDREIKAKGYASRAEYFRSAVQHYMDCSDELEARDIVQDPEFARLAKEMRLAIRQKFSGKKLPSLEEQFARIK